MSLLEDITYRRAERKILIDTLLLEDSEKVNIPLQPKSGSLELPELVPLNINSHDSPNPKIVKAWNFLFGRKLFQTNFLVEDQYYFCLSGAYRDRIIIPFRNEDKLFFFQARSLSNEFKPKYLNPQSTAAKSSHFLYPFDKDSEYVVICEGPLDAISLQLQGVNATCTMGCHVSHQQASELLDFDGNIILGYDNDDAGRQGVASFEKLRKKNLMAKFSVVYPPEGTKDWNDAHIKDINLKQYVTKNWEVYDYDYIVKNDIMSL